MTMSISSAPASTAWRVSASLMSRKVWPRREAGRDAGDLDAAALRGRPWPRGSAPGRCRSRPRGDRRIAGLGMDALGAQRPDLARRVLALEGRQIHHPDREVEGPQLRGLLDRRRFRRRRRAPRRRPGRRGVARPSRLPRVPGRGPTRARARVPARGRACRERRWPWDGEDTPGPARARIPGGWSDPDPQRRGDRAARRGERLRVRARCPGNARTAARSESCTSSLALRGPAWRRRRRPRAHPALPTGAAAERRTRSRPPPAQNREVASGVSPVPGWPA